MCPLPTELSGLQGLYLLKCALIGKRNCHPFDARRVLNLNAVCETAFGELSIVKVNIDISQSD
jgi:hypothetical protein